ncbi:MAG: PfkB family carbohydrate kinase [Pirellulales bacterium]
MSQHHLLHTIDSLGHPRVLVLGDLILDRYTWGNADRVSQEAPVILLKADTREDRLGGAGNVCQMLRGLDAQVTCAGVVGDDRDGETVRHLLLQGGVDTACVVTDPARPTTTKERFIGRRQPPSSPDPPRRQRSHHADRSGTRRRNACRPDGPAGRPRRGARLRLRQGGLHPRAARRCDHRGARNWVCP